MDFPAESVAIARDIAAKYRWQSSTLRARGLQLYKGDFLNIDYGFSEAIKQGRSSRYLHEIRKEAECFSLAAAIYLVARETNLKPRFWWSSGTFDTKVGESLENKTGGDHAFITIDTGAKLPYVVDPGFELWGPARFDLKTNRIIVDEKRVEHTTRHFTWMEELSQPSLLRKLADARAPGSGRIALAATQRLNVRARSRVFITYRPQTQELETSLHFAQERASADAYPERRVEIRTPVKPNGEFSLDQGTLFDYGCMSYGWADPVGPLVATKVPMPLAETFAKTVEEVLAVKGRSRLWTHGSIGDIARFIEGHGFTDEAMLIERSPLAKSKRFGARLEAIQNSITPIAQQQVVDMRADAVSHERFLRLALYNSRLRNAITKENPVGYLYSLERHDALLHEHVDAWGERYVQRRNDYTKLFKMQAGLVRGRARTLDTAIVIAHEKSTDVNDHMISLIRSRGIGVRKRDLHDYRWLADWTLFKREHEALTTDAMESMVSVADREKAARGDIVNTLYSYGISRKSLLVPSYVKGLRRMLAATER